MAWEREKKAIAGACLAAATPTPESLERLPVNACCVNRGEAFVRGSLAEHDPVLERVAILGRERNPSPLVHRIVEGPEE